ncbi:MAG: hypothetical protein AXA67_06175 [Methylothermaceae bacteria B42]|nr:MAG: hypothetical protein AXA67_06175 [Methylothermaceae bacteria B42]HHJ39876.1 flagellar export protein FliJ [Methylothermaceae bacterium]
MKRLKRLKPVEEFTAGKESAAAKVLNELSGKIQAAQHQLQELQRFREQYAAQFHQQNRLVSGLQIKEYQAFLAKLGSGIKAQEEKLSQLRQEFAAARQHWQEAYCRHKGIQKVRDNLQRRSRILTEQALQREMDDLAGRKKRSRSK